MKHDRIIGVTKTTHPPVSPRFRHIRRFIEATLLLLLLEVCLSIGMGRFTLINLSSLLADAGQMSPVVRYEQQSERSNPPTRIRKKGELYVVEVPIAFVPARHPVFIHETPGAPDRNSLQCSLYSREKMHPWQFPKELYYAELTAGQLASLVQRDKIYQPPALAHVRLVPADCCNHSEGVLIYDSREDDLLNLPEIQDRKGKGLRGTPQLYRLRIQNIPSRRTTYNYCLLPLSWCVKLVDIPLSLLATPIGWLADVIYESLHNQQPAHGENAPKE